MEVSFSREIESLRLGAGQTFHGEGILAITKALLQSGVAYVGAGNNYLCPGDYDDTYQKFGIPAHWSWDALRQYEGTLNREQFSGFENETFFDE